MSEKCGETLAYVWITWLWEMLVCARRHKMSSHHWADKPHTLGEGGRGSSSSVRLLALSGQAQFGTNRPFGLQRSKGCELSLPDPSALGSTLACGMKKNLLKVNWICGTGGSSSATEMISRLPVVGFVSWTWLNRRGKKKRKWKKIIIIMLS